MRKVDSGAVPPRVLLALLLGVLALAASGCGGGEEVTATPVTVETVATETGGGETGVGETESDPAEEEPDTDEAETEGIETEEAETEGIETEEAETGATETGAGGGTETGDEGGTETGGGGAAAEGDAAAGKPVWNANGCGGCHVLEAAGSKGAVGPNLDEAEPDFDEAVAQIANGGGGMPAYKGQLSEEQINNVAAYVVESAGGG